MVSFCTDIPSFPSQVPIVHVTAQALLPSTSVISFTLGNGLSFTTFVNTVPINGNRTVNRFALVRNLAIDKTGIFNMGAWDRFARQAMVKYAPVRTSCGLCNSKQYLQSSTKFMVKCALANAILSNTSRIVPDQLLKTSFALTELCCNRIALGKGLYHTCKHSCSTHCCSSVRHQCTENDIFCDFVVLKHNNLFHLHTSV